MRWLTTAQHPLAMWQSLVSAALWAACMASPSSAGLGAEPESAAADTPKATTTDASQPAYLLRYRFEPNQSIYFNVVHKSAILTKKGDAKQDALNETTTDKHIRVVSVDASQVALVESTIDRIQMRVKFDDDKPITYDSNSKEPPPGALRGVDKNVGRPLAMMQFAPDGTLVELVPLAAAKANAKFAGTNATRDDANRNFLIIFPPNPIRVGESWNDDIEVPVTVADGVQQPIKLRRQYSLKSIDGELATIQFLTKVLTSVNNPRISVQLIQRTPAGTVTFDMKKGQIVSRTHRTSERVFGFAGEGSSMSAEATLEERLIERPATAAAAK